MTAYNRSTMSARETYTEAVRVTEAALQGAVRAQWAGERADLHRDRKTLIELRHAVPNDKSDALAQVVRDLLTTYAAVLAEQSGKDHYERSTALSADLAGELARLRPRAARHALPVLTDDLREFKVGGGQRPRPAQTRPARAETPPRRRRRSRTNS